MRFALSAFAIVALMFAGSLAAQQPAKGKSYTMKGKVEEVGSDRVTVKHDKIDGYMAAMTMPYKVDRPDVLKQVKAGDEIEATVYQDDYTLYDLKVLRPAKGKAK
jgi:protein SCO1/2